MSYRGYSSPYYGSYYSSYKNKAPATPTRTTAATGGNSFRSSFSPLSTASSSSNAGTGAGSRYGSSRTTYSAASGSEEPSSVSSRSRQRDAPETPASAKVSYQAGVQANRISPNYSSTSNQRESNNGSSSTGSGGISSRAEPSKSIYGTTARDSREVGSSRSGIDRNSTQSSGNSQSAQGGSGGTNNSYSLGRSSNYGNLYKLPSSSAAASSTNGSSNYGNGWAERSPSGRSSQDTLANSSKSGASSRNGGAAPSAVSESNLLSPYAAGGGYTRSKSREKETEAPKTEASGKSESSSMTLPRSFRAYNQRGNTSTTFQSPSTYTPRVPTSYGRSANTTSRDLSYATKPATQQPTERLSAYRSMFSEPVSKSLPVVSVEEIKEIPPTPSEDAVKSDSAESEESDEEEATEETPEADASYVVSRGTSPIPSSESIPSSKASLLPISGFIRSPKVLQSRLPTVAAREVQTEEPDSIRPRRFVGYTGSPPTYGSAAAASRPGSYTDRYFSKYVAPSRYSSGTSPPAEEKTKSPPISGTLHKPPIPVPVVGSKEYRKSALNVDLDDQQISEFRKRQEEFREAQRRAKRQARKNSSGGSKSSSASPGPVDRRTPSVTPASSRRNSVNSEKGSTSLSRSSSAKIQQPKQQAAVSRSQSRRKVVTSAKNSSSSRSSSCSSSSSGAEEAAVVPEEMTSRIKSKSSSSASSIGASASLAQPVRKSSTSSESISRLSLSRTSAEKVLTPASSPRRSTPLQPSSSSSSSASASSKSPSKSRSPSVNPSAVVHSDSPQLAVQPADESSRSQSRSSSVNWSKLLKMTRGPEERSSTSPESLVSKSSSSSQGNRKAVSSRSPSYSKMMLRSPEAGTSGGTRSVTRSPSGAVAGRVPSRAASSTSLPPPPSSLPPPNRSGRTTASSSRSHIPSRNASARSIARSCSTSTDSSTSTESDRVQKHSRSVSRIKDSANSSKRNSLEPSGGGLAESSSFASKLASSFGWLRKQNSEIIPWWLPSTDNVPAMEQEEEGEAAAGEQQKIMKPEESSTSSADETQSSTEEETESTENKRDDTDVEVDDLPADLGIPKLSGDSEPAVSIEAELSPSSSPLPVKETDDCSRSDVNPEELGDRYSPDGFEWPECPATPPMTRSYPFYRRPPSPYDNVKPDIPVMTSTSIQPSPSGCSMNTAWGLDALRALESLEPINIQPQKSKSPLNDFSKDQVIKAEEEEEENEEEEDDEDEEEEEDEEEQVKKEIEIKQEEEEDVEEEEESDDSSEEEEEEGDRDQVEEEPIVKDQEETDSESVEKSASAAVPSTAPEQQELGDATFQVYKDGDYGNYLDVEATLNEQSEELEGFLENRKNSIVLRTQLSVRVNGIMDKLLHSEGKELRRALFSLKQIFQEDKDLVHEFVQNDGLACLIRVGHTADQNFQNYILRALGQVMLYVDGMNGVMEHNPTVQWLYSLIASKYRLVAKTALKLLLVFVEYVESNCQLLVKAIETVDSGQDSKPWSSLMRLLQERDSSDSELLVYAVTLINKTLHGLPDQDSYYDQIENLEALGMQQIVTRFVSKPEGDADLIQQLEIYEHQLKQEDGEPYVNLDYSNQHSRVPRSGRSNHRSPRHPSNQTQQGNKRLNSFQLLQTVTGDGKNQEEDISSGEEHGAIVRKLTASQSKKHLALLANELADKSFNQWSSSSSESSCSMEDVKQHMLNGSKSHVDLKDVNDVGVTPALRRRRERAERQRSLIREQEDAARMSPSQIEEPFEDSSTSFTISVPKVITVADVADENRRNVDLTLNMPPISERISNLQKEKDKDNIDRNLLDISREASVKDLTERLQANHISANPTSPTEEKFNRLGDLSGIISKAKEELTKSKSRHDLRNLEQNTALSPTGKAESKKSENELHWESLLETLDRPLQICDLDFTDLHLEEDSDPLNPSVRVNAFGPPPPPPPPNLNGVPPPPMPGLMPPPPPPSKSALPPPVFFGVQLHHNGTEPTSSNTLMKQKKTVKLFWREIREDQLSLIKGPTLWDELHPVAVDTKNLEHLFESRSKDLITKEKQQESTKNKELIVLDPKRSNSINIGMTKLPPPRTIKTAILKMDSTIINREGIEKLLTMLPTDEERAKIQEAQLASPELPLGSAEQFLLSLASITELAARLKLWLFKSDYENMEKELAEPLMDLKQGIEILQSNVTFRAILATLLAVGNFLNGAEIKGFQVDYLAKVPEVKDTVHKHSLLHHLCHMIMEQNVETTDLYSEIGAVTRASRVDYDELAANLNKMEEDCKASWDHLRAIAKHDGNTTMKIKMSEFLTDCAERIMVATIVHRRVTNRFRKFLLWLGTPPAQVRETKPGTFCRIVSEFALEYRTTRDRVLQQMEKKANHRERSKTRGKMITQIGSTNGLNSLSSYDSPVTYRTKEDRADAELRQLLGSDISDTESMRTGTWGRSRKSMGLGRSTSIRDDYLTDAVTDGDDEILESLVKTATRTTTHPRERKRSNRQHNHADRSSALKRSRTRDNNVFQPLPEESRH
ncbi:uncharacterized protein LOC124194434 isoform X4 [Daphnia pulex]|uniref:uncharacterized protein LOC124194434 isoform X4 n=1 Tax=Daphnia pulex TaxID=6669 RepID=UPI001EE02D72|nr:uncharacterized protein LOC124194434 isoform X4 [Daphnia pulex]